MTTYSTRIPASKVKALQELLGRFNLYFEHCPYPIVKSNPEGQWQVTINYNDCTQEKRHAFDLAFERITMPIKETRRKFSLLKKIKIKTVNQIKLILQ